MPKKYSKVDDNTAELIRVRICRRVNALRIGFFEKKLENVIQALQK